jgi:hypothetical protein
MKVSPAVAFLLLICVIATAVTIPSRRLRVASPKEAPSGVDDEGFQGVDSVENKEEEDAPGVEEDLKDHGSSEVLQQEKEENNDDKSSMRVASLKDPHSVDDEGFLGVDSVDNNKAAGDAPVVDLKKDGRKVLQKEEENNDDKSSMRVASRKEAHSVDDEGFQGVDSVDNKAEDAPVVELKDGRKVLQKEENNDEDSKSSMKEEDCKQVILDLRGQIQERDATIEELRDEELRMKELNRRPDLQGDHVEPVLRFAWKFVLLMQASSESLEKKEKKAEPLVIGSNDFVVDHLARHKFLDDTIPKRVEAMQNLYKSQQDSRSQQFAKLKGVSGSFMSSRAGLQRPRPAGDSLHPLRPTGEGLHPQEMVSLMYGFVRRYIEHSKIFVCLTSTVFLFHSFLFHSLTWNWNEWIQVTSLVNSTNRRPPGSLLITSITQMRSTRTRMRVEILITRESRVI